MEESELERKNSADLEPREHEAILRMRQQIVSGKHWYIALLEAISTWNLPEEEHDGRRFQYIIAGEAFDWLLLAERLSCAVDGLIPDKERSALLFSGQPPLEIPEAEFKRLIGPVKHAAYLNYWYGVAVEEALILATEEEVRKERRGQGHNEDVDLDDDVYGRIYGHSRTDLLKLFRKEKGYTQSRSISIGQIKEFTYWLFKFRLKNCEKAKVASDTRKGLLYLNHLWQRVHKRAVSSSTR